MLTASTASTNFSLETVTACLHPVPVSTLALSLLSTLTLFLLSVLTLSLLSVHSALTAWSQSVVFYSVCLDSPFTIFLYLSLQSALTLSILSVLTDCPYCLSDFTLSLLTLLSPLTLSSRPLFTLNFCLSSLCPYCQCSLCPRSLPTLPLLSVHNLSLLSILADCP